MLYILWKLFYLFERDSRTGEEFLSPPESRTAYRNGTFFRYVFLRNGLVERVSDHDGSAPASAASEGSEEELFALPEDAAAEPEEPEATESEASEDAEAPSDAERDTPEDSPPEE